MDETRLNKLAVKVSEYQGSTSDQTITNETFGELLEDVRNLIAAYKGLLRTRDLQQKLISEQDNKLTLLMSGIRVLAKEV